MLGPRGVWKVQEKCSGLEVLMWGDMLTCMLCHRPHQCSWLALGLTDALPGLIHLETLASHFSYLPETRHCNVSMAGLESHPFSESKVKLHRMLPSPCHWSVPGPVSFAGLCPTGFPNLRDPATSRRHNSPACYPNLTIHELKNPARPEAHEKIWDGAV